MVTRVDEYEVSKLNLGSLEGETWFFYRKWFVGG